MKLIARASVAACVFAFAASLCAACEDSSSSSSGGVAGFDGGFDGGFDAPVSPLPDASATDAPTDAVDAADAAAANDVYVDPVNGLDTNAGKETSPFKTIAKASTVVPVGSTVWLLDGAYDAANQGSAAPLALPEGATLRAKHVGLAVIEGLPIVAAGAANAVAGLVFDKGTTLAASNSVAAAPTLTVTNVEWKSRAGASSTLSVAGNTKVTLTQSNFTGPLPSADLVKVGGAAELVIIGATFDGLGGGVEGFGYQLIGATGTSKLTLDGVTMKNFGAAAIGVAGSSNVTPVVVVLKNGTVLDAMGTADNCASGASIILAQNADLTVDASEIKNAKTAGICVRNGVASHINVTLKNGAKLTNDVNGVRSEPGTASEMTLVVNGATFASNISAGVYFEGSGSFDFTAATMTGNGSGVVSYASLPLSIKARSSTFTSNTAVGVGVTTAGTLTLDLGTAASLGKNTFTANTTTGLRLDVPAAQTHTAVGNTWNASVQSADGAGHYSAGTDVIGPSSGANYALVNASTLTL